MKSSLRDIIPSEKRSIRDIPLSHKRLNVEASDVNERVSKPRRKLTKEEVFDTPDEDVFTDTESVSSFKKQNQTSGKTMWLVAFSALVLLVGTLLWLFSKTEVVIDLKKATFTIENESFFAESDSNQEASFRFNTVELSDEVSKVVEAKGQKEVSAKAKGTVVVFNNFSTATQQLVAGTRLEDQNGHIFRIDKSVIVPGKKTVSGKIVPGSVEVAVTADEAGARFNIPLSDFTIPGFKGTPKFNGFYARSKTLMLGGMEGTVPVIEAEALLGLETEMKKELETAIIAKVRAELPKEFILLEGAYRIAFEPVSSVNEGDKAKITMKATIKAFTFKATELLAVLAKEKQIPLEEGFNTNPDFASLQIVSITEEGTRATFGFNGTVRFTYHLDDEKLKTAIVGQKKKEIPKILTQFPIIEKAQVIVTPFWFSSVTSNTSKINITKNSLGNQ